MTTTPHDHADEPRQSRPSVPLVVFDAGGRPMWKRIGEEGYQYEPELEQIYMTAQQTIKPILKYPGAKWNLAPWIISHFPAHAHYVEPFFGSGAVFFNKAPAKHEVINDLSDEIFNLFKVMRDDGERLVSILGMTAYGRTEYEFSYECTTDATERARRLIVRAIQGHGSIGASREGSWARGLLAGSAIPRRSWLDMPDRAWAQVQRLRNAEIEHTDAIALIRDMAGSDVLIYADPPYPLGERKGDLYLVDEMTDADHAALLDALDAHPGPVVLSGYHCALYDDRLRHWHTREKQAQAEKGNTRTEVLWLNQVCVDRLGYGPLWDIAA